MVSDDAAVGDEALHHDKAEVMLKGINENDLLRGHFRKAPRNFKKIGNTFSSGIFCTAQNCL